MTRPVTVYTKPNCTQCDMTKRWLDREGVPFTVDDITDEANLAAAKHLGFAAAPVVVVGGNLTHHDTIWSGFRPDLLATITQGATL